MKSHRGHYKVGRKVGEPLPQDSGQGGTSAKWERLSSLSRDESEAGGHLK